MREQVMNMLSFVSLFFAKPEESRESGQSHILEIIVGILIVVVLGVFLYTTGVPSIETLWNDAMTTIGTISE